MCTKAVAANIKITNRPDPVFAVFNIYFREPCTSLHVLPYRDTNMPKEKKEKENNGENNGVLGILLILGFGLCIAHLFDFFGVSTYIISPIFELFHRFTFFLFKFTDVFDFFGSRNPTSQVKQANDVYCKYTIMHH